MRVITTINATLPAPRRSQPRLSRQRGPFLTLSCRWMLWVVLQSLWVAQGATEPTTTSELGEPQTSSSLWSALWERLAHLKDDVQDILKEEEESDTAQQQQQQQQQQYPHRRITKRRALYEQAVSSHYRPYLIREEEKLLKYQLRPPASSWSEEDCLYWKESNQAHWNFQYCPSLQTLQQVHYEAVPRSQAATLTQKDQEETPIVWKPVSDVSLGRLLLEGTPEYIREAEYKVWNHTLEGWNPFESKDAGSIAPRTTRVDYFVDGSECRVTLSTSTKEQPPQYRHQGRRSLKIENHPQACPSSATQPHIASVVEPATCFYVVFVCHLDEKESSEDLPLTLEEFQNDDATEVPLIDRDAAHPEKQQQRDDSQQQQRQAEYARTVLESYLYQSGVEAEQPQAADRATSLHIQLPPFPPSRRFQNQELVRHMFTTAYDAYMYNAYPASELEPLTCTPGTFDLVKLPALTLVDTLDFLVLLHNETEFARSVERLRVLNATIHGSQGWFGVSQNVSVFETNIRILGGLLSAHQLAQAYLTDRTVRKQDVWDAQGQVRIGPVRTRYDDENKQKTSNKRSPSPLLGQDHDCRQNQASPTIATEAPVDVEVDASCSLKLVNGEASSTSNICPSQKTTKKCANATASRTKIEYWVYDGVLLDMAHDLGRRLLPAFDTGTGIPYGTVNLVSGIPEKETTIASLAGGGTLTLEMELLSRLTGDESFGNAAKLASRALWMRRSKQSELLGKHIEIQKGDWTETLSGIGSNSDSFYEYLVKHYILFPDDDDFWYMFVSAYNGVHSGTRLGEWYPDADMKFGVKKGGSRKVLESLMAFYSGMQILLGELAPAARTLNSFFLVRELLGFLPERFNYGNWRVDGGGGAGKHPLRPELLESCYFLHRATRTMGTGQSASLNSTASSSGWLWAADYALHALHEMSDTGGCGYATIDNIGPTTTGNIPGREGTNNVQHSNEMPSFFLSETLKYLFLTFDEDNKLHTDDERDWIFTTEAHPIHSSPKRTPELSRRDQQKVELDKMKQSLVTRLQERSDAKRKGERPAPFVSNSKANPLLDMEKWSINTHLPIYKSELHKSVTQMLLSRKRPQAIHRDASKPDAMSFVYPIASLSTEDLNAKDAATNAAYLSIGNSLLAKACPNFHASSLDWIRALNGGVVDYADIYVTSLSNDGEEQSESLVGLSACEALAYHGSGLFLGEDPNGQSRQCALVGKQDPLLSDHVEEESSENMNGGGGVPTGAERVDLGGGLGAFDVSVFSEGVGFFVHHIASGEKAMVSIVDEEEGSEASSGSPMGPFVMVYSSNPVMKDQREEDDTQVSGTVNGIRWKALFGRVEDGKTRDSEEVKPPARKVIFADSKYGSFSCEVQVVETSALLDQEPTEMCSNTQAEDCSEDWEIVLGTFPCAPAMFGPTLLSTLAETDGIWVEGSIRLPDSSDEEGCKDPLDESQADEKEHASASISMVHRGTCSFESKATNQKNRYQSEAVVVVNSEDDALFLMAEGGPSEDTCDTDTETEIPVTVMVTGQDGKELTSIVHNYDDHRTTESSMLATRIVLLPAHGAVEDNAIVESETGELDWPVVRVGATMVEFFSEGGWGVHARSRNAENKAAQDGEAPTTEWQLYLTKHGQQEKDSNQSTE